MSKDEREFLEKLRATSIHAAAEVLEGLQRLRDFHDELADDGSGTVSRPRLGDHFYQLAKLELEHAASVMRLGSVQAEMLFDHVRQLARAQRGGEPPLRVLELQPANGDHANTFEVRNPFEHPADVRFEIQPFGDAIKTEARSRISPIPPHATSLITVTAVGTITGVMFGQIDVYLSAEVEKRIARRSLKVRQHA
ncbi:MAG: hypothetical protein ABI867_06090 [Kofleriaceae bacterium]